MTWYKVLAFFFLVGHLSLFGQSKLQDNQITKIVFLGNSVTYAGTYVTFIDAYLTLRDPQKNMKSSIWACPVRRYRGYQSPITPTANFPVRFWKTDWVAFYPKPNPIWSSLVME